MSEPDPTVLDSAMATGNDQGEYGPPSVPLDADERALLADLQHDDGADVVEADEDRPEFAQAVDDDTVPPR